MGSTRTMLAPDGDGFVDAETGSRWDIFGRAVDGPLAGSAPTPLVATPALWYGWAALYETALYETTLYETALYETAVLGE